MGARAPRRTIEERAADDAVLAALRARGGVATRADLVVDTALPEMVVERALERLLDAYVSSVGVARGGTLLYRFAEGFPRRRERRAVLRAFFASLARAGAEAARIGRIVFRAVLAVQLLVYVFIVLVPVSVIIGVVVGIGILILGIFSEGGGDLIALMTEPWSAAIVLGICICIGIYYTFKKKYELLLMVLGVRRVDVTSKGVDGLVARVNTFALGPAEPARLTERIDRTWTISQADERRVLARLRARGGRLRAGDLVAWLGLPFDEADSQATRLAVEYGGEPAPLEASGVEVLEFRFPSLMTTASERPTRRQRRGGRAPEDEPTRFERGEAPPAFTGNQPRHDLAVAAFALVNLTAGLIAWQWLGPRRDEGGWWWLAWLAGSALPVCFSLLLFALPVVRWPAFMWRRVRRLVELARARMLAAFVRHVRERGDEPVDLEGLAQEWREDEALPRPSPAELRAVALALGGESDLDAADDPGKTVWRFRRLAAELRHVPGEAAAGPRRIAAQELVEPL